MPCAAQRANARCASGHTNAGQTGNVLAFIVTLCRILQPRFAYRIPRSQHQMGSPTAAVALKVLMKFSSTRRAVKKRLRPATDASANTTDAGGGPLTHSEELTAWCCGQDAGASLRSEFVTFFDVLRNVPTALNRAFSPQGLWFAGNLGLRPRLVCNGPLALKAAHHTFEESALKSHTLSE